MSAPDEVQAARDELSVALARVDEMMVGEATGTDIVPSRSSDPVEAKRQLAGHASELRKQQEIARRAAERLENAMKHELSRVERVLAPLKATVKRIEAAIFSVNLYLGREEEVVLLRDGESAPADTPIGLRQLVLYMDEEMAAVAPEGGFKPTDIETFDEWLLADPAHLDQVLPEAKGIVALRPRRKEPRYGRELTNDELKAMRRTYWLVRNGERVYRTVTLLELNDRVLPYTHEMTRLFMRDRDGRLEPLKPGSHDWERAQGAAADREETYMRVGLVLEGLLHRTPMFHPLPEHGVSFLDPRFVEAGIVRYITDADGLIGTGSEPFDKWRRRLAGDLQPGMRIVLGPGIGQHDAREYGRGNSRLSPKIANHPYVGRVYTLETRGSKFDRSADRRRTALVFRYHEGERWVGDGAWGGGEHREPKRRASCTVFVDDDFVLPYDLATVEEMEAFLRRRSDRHHYEEMFPILKAAIAAKRREAEIERPFREMLVGVLARDNGVSPADADAAVDELVAWWKLKNTVHRPLLLAATRQDDESDQARVLIRDTPRGRSNPEALREREERDTAEDVERAALATRMIVAEHARRLVDARRPLDPRVLARLRAEHPVRLVIARPRGRGYLVVVAAEPETNAYVHEYEYSARGVLREAREWMLPRLTTVQTWRIVEQNERWEAWDFTADEREYLRGPERDALRAAALAHFETFEAGLAVAQARGGERFYVWTYVEGAKTDDERPLTGELAAPKIEEHRAKWRRGDNGAARLRWSDDSGLSSSSSRSDFGTRYEKTLPWEKRARRMNIGAADHDLGPMFDTLRVDETMVRRLLAEAARYEAASARCTELRIRTSLLTDSVEQEWLRRRWAEERARFDDDFGDVMLWPSHRSSMERHIHLPRDWRLQRYAGRHRDDLALLDAVGRLVEVGEDPEGRTVADVCSEATERWGEEEAKADSWHRESDGPVKRFGAPADLADFVLTTYVFEHDPTCDRCGEAHATEECPVPVPDDGGDDLDLLAGLREALADDEDEEVFVDGLAFEDERRLDG